VTREDARGGAPGARLCVQAEVTDSSSTMSQEMVLGEQFVQPIIKETYISRVKIEVDLAPVNQ